jgi:hypothetical protein
MLCAQTNVEIMNEEDFNSLLRQEEEYVEQICAHVSSLCGPCGALVLCGVHDHCAHES